MGTRVLGGWLRRTRNSKSKSKSGGVELVHPTLSQVRLRMGHPNVFGWLRRARRVEPNERCLTGVVVASAIGVLCSVAWIVVSMRLIRG